MNLSQFFQEASGKPSSVRLVSAVLALVVVGTWAYVSIMKQELQALDFGQVAIGLGGLAGKVWQKGKESDGLSG